MNYKSISTGDREMFSAILKNSEVYKNYAASELTFQNLFVWGKVQNIQYFTKNNIIFVKNYFEDSHIILPPLCKTFDELDNALSAIEKMHEGFTMRGVPENIAKRYAARYNFLEDRNLAEYIYNTDDLISLAGAKFHDKKNLVRQFEKYCVSVSEYNAAEHYQKILSFQNAFNLPQEFQAVQLALDNFDALDMKCLVFSDGDKLIAFAAGFITEFNQGVIMFEKADRNYKGIYAALNNAFVKRFFVTCTSVNMQEDMGFEGLRKSKLSYNPISITKKYITYSCVREVN